MPKKPATRPRRPRDWTPADVHAEQLIAIYAKAERQLQQQIRQAIDSGALGTATYLQRQVAAAKLILAQLRNESEPRVYASVARIYTAAGRAAFEAGGLGATFGGVNQRAILQLASAMNQRVDGAIVQIGRRVEDLYRQTALEVISEGVVKSTTRREVSAALAQKLLEDKITDATTGFVDRAGRRWSLENYSRMVARTTTREAMSASVLEQVRAGEDDLVSISEHPNPADVCLPYAGRTFSLDGKTPGYEILDQLPPFHPNCLHVVTPAAATFDAFEAELLKNLKDPALLEPVG